MVAKLDGKMSNVATVAAPSFIEGPANINHADDEVMTFGLRNPNAQSSEYNILRPISPSH
jgi:hypothetical protein